MIFSRTGFSLCGFVGVSVRSLICAPCSHKGSTTQAEACVTEGLKLQGWLAHPMQGAT